MRTKDKFAEAMLAGKPLPLPIIDMHGHLDELAAYYIPGPDAASMVKVMDSLGVQAIAVSAHAAISADYRLGNDFVAKAVKDFPGRFIGYAVANPHYSSEIEGELDRCFDKHGFRLIKLHPGSHRYPLTGPWYEPAYEFAAKHRMPILAHTWEDDPHCKPDIAAEAARRHPDVTLIMGHSGAPSFEKALDHAVAIPNLYLDLGCSRVFSGTIEYFVKRAPVEKIIYGSDLPFLSMPQQVAKVAFAAVSEADKRKIFRENAIRLLTAAGLKVA